MPGVARGERVDSAGGAIIGHSPDVKVNGVGVARIGDEVQGHGPGEHGSPVMATGSSDVFANNIPICRETVDIATCGHQATGSSDTFIN